MACKCVLIDKLERDIKYLRIAEEHAMILADKTKYVNESLTELASMYSTTVKAPVDLASGFTALDKDAVANSQILVTKLREAQDKAMAKMEKAIVEDDKFHGSTRIVARMEVMENVRFSNIM